ncbi:MAG: hypothetical protein AAGC81_03515 [Pseudomonadota bacterium]
MGRQLLEWSDWQPGLDTDEMSLREVLDTLPAANAEDVPDIIRKYENPSSPDALPGAIALDRHDCLHVILGRGLRVQDEAFVIGATMGAASDITSELVEQFIEISTKLYPPHWRFEDAHIPSYRLGVGFAKDMLANKDLHLIPFEGPKYQQRKVGEIRDELGLVKSEMRAYFRKEEILVPGTRASRRLDTSARRPDKSLE